MNTSTAFIGDVHGNERSLRGLWGALSELNIGRTVFLGDYINKGSRSVEVLDFLGELAGSGLAILLRGNHESALLESIEARNLAPFLKMGGAMTIRSYIGRPVGPDVWTEFVESIPKDHLDLLRGMRDNYEDQHVVARHAPWASEAGKYAISAHRQVGTLPKIGPSSAQIDTGCGDPGGRLTALLWPSLDHVQVDDAGQII